MWKDLAGEGAEPVPTRRQRYLAFVDYLGTSELYREAERYADRIEDRRHELEHAIQIRLQEAIARGRIEVGVFSDTVMIAGEGASDVLAAAASLFEFVFTKDLRRNDPDDIRLLRGGLSRGAELRTSYLRAAPGVSVIPFFDGSLAFAFSLEQLRRGSRLFMPKELQLQELPDVAAFVFPWKNFSGVGAPAADLSEFLWPAYQWREEPEKLARAIEASFALWRRAHQAKPIHPDLYRTTLYHFDETIKCLIRSTVAFANSSTASHLSDLLARLLPSADDPMDEANIRFVWGFWFQIAYVLMRLGTLDRHDREVRFLLAELRRRGYLDKFIAELDYEDYLPLRASLAPYFEAHEL
jgi:hypothetical protein